jgi:hypothetical protein
MVQSKQSVCQMGLFMERETTCPVKLTRGEQRRNRSLHNIHPIKDSVSWLRLVQEGDSYSEANYSIYNQNKEDKLDLRSRGGKNCE